MADTTASRDANRHENPESRIALTSIPRHGPGIRSASTPKSFLQRGRPPSGSTLIRAAEPLRDGRVRRTTRPLHPDEITRPRIIRRYRGPYAGRTKPAAEAAEPERASPLPAAAAQACLRSDRPAARAAHRAGDGDRASRPDELGQDARRAALSRRDGSRRLRGAAADARAGGAPAARGGDRRRARRARHRRGARQPGRADHLLHRRDGAAARRDARARRGAVGRGRGARLGVDAADARRRVPQHPPARRGGGAAARPARVPRRGGPLLRAQGAARLGRQARHRRPRHGNRRRRVQPPRRDRARRRAEPAPPGEGRVPVRRDAARVAPRRDRPLPRGAGGGVRRRPTCSATA